MLPGKILSRQTTTGMQVHKEAVSKVEGKDADSQRQSRSSYQTAWQKPQVRKVRNDILQALKDLKK